MICYYLFSQNYVSNFFIYLSYSFFPPLLGAAFWFTDPDYLSRSYSGLTRVYSINIRLVKRTGASESLGVWTLPIVRYSENQQTTFRRLDLFQFPKRRVT